MKILDRLLLEDSRMLFILPSDIPDNTKRNYFYKKDVLENDNHAQNILKNEQNCLSVILHEHLVMASHE